MKAYPNARESIDGHLYIAALQTDHDQFADALATVDEMLARTNLTYADRIEAFARKGYVLIELHRFEDADAALDRRGRRVAQGTAPRGPVLHRDGAATTEASSRTASSSRRPSRLPDDAADRRPRGQSACSRSQAYDRWKESLGFKQAYWATASGYQMSQIFVELWEAHVKAPYPEAHRRRRRARSTSSRSTTAFASTSRRRSKAIA